MTNITPEQIAHVLELDGNRAQGKWMLGGCSGRMITVAGGYCGDGFLADVDIKDNAAFIAAAPLMAQIIRQQQALLVEARGALEYAWERIYINVDGDCELKHPFELERVIRAHGKLTAAIGEK